MTANPRVDELLEHILDAQCTPEEACAQSPELLAEVRERWKHFQLIDEQLDLFFPSTPPEALRDTSDAVHADDARLPQIDGYNVQRVLGRGGMGVVYRAWHVALSRHVALKMLLSGGYAAPQELLRFRREAQAVAALRHPNIVQIYDVGEVDRRPYFTMEYVEGGSLAERLSGNPQPARDAAAIVVTLAKAVQIAHDGGIVHRDLKPANVLLTTDGTPKITDFGLARRFEGDADLTLSGAMIGTPSYMAPEQAAGKSNAVGPAADIYSLGAILYEMLTGRPPFRAETAIETQRQVITEEPVSPSRLNAQVPRDLTTICLKCLSKDPQRRYVSAVVLAEDLQRYLRGEPILARATGSFERGRKWAARNRLLSGTLLGGGLLLVAVSAAGWKFMLDRATVLQAVQIHFSELEVALKREAWSEARAKLDLTEARLRGAEDRELNAKIGKYRRQLELVEQLEAIRLKRADTIPGVNNFDVAARAYREAFLQAQMFTTGEEPKVVAERIRSTAVAPAIVVAIDDWALCVWGEPEMQSLLDIALLADSNPSNVPLRNRRLWSDPPALQKLVAELPIGDQSVALMVGLSDRFHQIGGNSVPFLKRIHQKHPDDFWINYALALALHQNPGESIRYYQAAIALRPNAAPAYDNLGIALADQKRESEALDEFKTAVRLNPFSTISRYNLGHALANLGRRNDAIEELQHALECDPNFVRGRGYLGYVLADLDRHDEAIVECRRAINLDRREWLAYRTVRTSTLKLGRPEEALAEWKEMLALEPPGHEEWDGYAELCLFLGQADEYRKARQELLQRFGNTTEASIAERTGRSCLFLPASDDELRQAMKLIDLALTSESPQARGYFRYFRFAKGLAEYRSGRFENAVKQIDSETLRVLGPAPRLLLAMCQYRLGQIELARENYASATAAFDWNLTAATTADSWRYHLLHREAESLIARNP
jgi:tetratricopeptide (TPR) repeat protein